VRLSLALAVIAPGLLLLSYSCLHSANDVDISGSWTVTLRTVESEATIPCAFDLSQEGTELSALVQCEGLSPNSYTGSLDPLTRSFIISGTVLFVPVSVEGTVSEDDAMSGTFDAEGVLSGTFTGIRDAEASGDHDLTGDWIIHLGGERLRRCEAALEQSGSDLTASFECDGSESGTVTGSSSAQGFSLRGDLLGRSFQLAGLLSEDGDALSATWGPAGRLLWPAAGVRRDRRAGPADLSGDWSSTLNAAFALTCRSAIRQQGTTLSSVVSCGSWLSEGTMTGTMDQQTGIYQLTGRVAGDAEVVAVVSADGSSTVGAFSATAPDLVGTLIGSRLSETPTFIDVGGSWDMRLVGSLPDDCLVTVMQDDALLSGSASCESSGSGEIEGHINTLTGTFSLHGPLGDRELFLNGEATQEARSLDGIWMGESSEPTKDGGLGPFGCFSAHPSDGTPASPCVPPCHHPAVQTHAPCPDDTR